MCQERVLLGMNKPYERQGAFAELITVPDQNIYEIPEKLDIKEATIAEPTAVSLHAVLMAEVSSIKHTKIKNGLKNIMTQIQRKNPLEQK